MEPYTGRHRAPTQTPPARTKPNSDMQTLDALFMDDTSPHHRKALRDKEMIVTTLDGHDPYGGHPDIEAILTRKRESDYVPRHSNIRKAGDVALFAAGVVEPSAPDASAYPAAKTEATAPTDAQGEANHPAEADYSQLPQDNQEHHP